MEQDFHQRADAAMAQGDFGRAIAALESAIGAAPDDTQAWLKLAALRRRVGDVKGALDAANMAVDRNPHDFIMLLLKASIHEQLGELDRAAEIYRAALFHADDPANLPPPLAHQIQHASRFLATYRERVEAEMDGVGSLDPVHGWRKQRFLDNVLDRRPVHHQEPTHYRYPGLADIEFFDQAYPDLIDRLREATPAIRAECEALLRVKAARQRPYVDFAPGQPVGVWRDLNRSPKWNSLHLMRYGEVDAELAALCPQTMAALAGSHQPDIANLAPNVMFSLLAPKTQIPAHHGVANFRSVLHLPLVVPAGCRFRVGSETRAWQEGEPWIFDDTIEHEAWNDSDELRIVMIADVWRPELDEKDREIVRSLMRAMALPSTLGAL